MTGGRIPHRGAAFVRSLPALAAALVRSWWPQVAALGAAAAVVAATITGALGVGSALRRGLGDLALERLGGIEAAVVTDDAFRTELAADLGGAARNAVPAIVADVSVERPAGAALARGAVGATLLACDDPAALGFAAPRRPSGDGVLVNAPLAAALGVAASSDLVVRLPHRSAVPADSPLGRRAGLAAGMRTRVAAVLPDRGLGRFALEPAAATRPLVVAPLAVGQRLLGRAGVANRVLLGGADAAAGLRSALRLDDLGLVLGPVAGDAALRLTSRRLILPAEVDRAAAEVLGPLGGRPTLVFLATALEPLDSGTAAATIPYSTVLGIESTSLPVGDLVDDDGRPLPVPADDEILVDRWMADDLAAQGRPVAVGDRLELRCFLPETLHGRVEETKAAFKIAGIAAMRGAAIERGLVPDVEGVTDEASIADWDPPFPFDRTRVRSTPPHDEDERYWKTHGAAPKAFVSLAAARRLAGSRFGATTAWLVPAAPGLDAGAVAARLAAALDPAALGVRTVPLRAEALAAARGSTPFGALFLALSSFVVAAGLLLEWLLFGLLVATRRRDVGLLAAVGWPPGRIARLLLAVGAAAACGGAMIGAAIGPAWARALLAGLSLLWSAAVEPGAAAAFARWPAAADVWPGALVAAGVSLAALAVAARRAASISPAALLAGRGNPGAMPLRRRGGATLAVAAAALAAAAGCAAAGRGAASSSAVGLFFAAGCCALGGFLAVASWWLARRAGGAARSLAALARRGLAHRLGRAFAVVALVAVAQFLVVAVSAFRLAPPARPADRAGPTGGWTSIVSFASPTSLDPSDAETRSALGLAADDDQIVSECEVALLRSSGGADADCTNLYDAAGRGTVLGVATAFVARGGFRFVATARPVANPWTLLDRPADAAGPVPAILDAATAQWALKLGGVGARFTLPDGTGRPAEFEIVGLLDLSILQGYVIVAEREFERLFSTRSGYGMALVDAGGPLAAGRSPDAVSRALGAAWADAAPDVAATADRLARLQAVQNTFLAAFQALGTLGLLLGTAGVAAVQAQGIAERRGPLALLRAVGFTPARLRSLLVLETLWTVALGLAAGTAAGWLAVAPVLRGGGLPLAWVAGSSGLVLAAAVVACLVAVARQAIPERPRME